MYWLRPLESAVEQEMASNDDLAPSMRFDFERYINKLLSPCNHIRNLFSASSHSPYNSATSLPLDVQTVVSDIEAVSFDIPSESDITSWLDRLYTLIPREDRDDDHQSSIVRSVYSTIVNQLSRGGNAKLNIQEPHCKCVLVRYHHLHSHGQFGPYPYIAVSKSSCLLCALFVAAYRHHASNQPELTAFDIAGCNSQIIPSQLPLGLENDLDQEITNCVLESIDKLMVHYLSKKLYQYKHAKKLSQSTTGSSDSDDEYLQEYVDSFIISKQERKGKNV
ncbi:hypothetical protein VKT23_014419 [Stygiomarasmius scandens]|uniref:Uncharacterized protein n=1 Tax=Marasmiellus scandens TaxID=2682957 RepID=A0ABR1J3Z2_9AGAR